MLSVAIQIGGQGGLIHPTVLKDEDGLTLVDTGFPRQLQALEQALEEDKLRLSEVRRVLLTHQDIDHIGGLAEVVQRTGAEVLAYVDEAPYIEGKKPLIKFSRAFWEPRLASMPAESRADLEALLDNPPKTEVTRLLVDDERLELAGGVRVVHTPGHTPGHISLFLETAKVLLAGDALRVDEGVLVGPGETVTPDMPRALASLKRFSDLPAEYVVCYHGGIFGPNAAARLAELARS